MLDISRYNSILINKFKRELKRKYEDNNKVSTETLSILYQSINNALMKELEYEREK